MRISLAILGLVGGASAFQSASSPRVLRASVLRMSDESEAPLLQAKEKVPCFPLTPLLGGEYFIGENYWDLLTTEYGSEATGTFIQAAEIKHGRAAMLATVGFAFHKLGLTLDHISPHKYLSVTHDIKFADLAALTPLEAFKAVPSEGLIQMFFAVAAIELFELTGNFTQGKPVAPGLQAGGLTGDLGWNPLQIKVNDRRRFVEVQNGRAAMYAICAWVAHDAIAGSVPLPLPWP